LNFLKGFQLSGFQLMLLSAFFFSLMNVLARLLPEIPAVELAFFRSLVTLSLSLATLKWQGRSVWGEHRTLLLLRGIFGSAGLILYFMTLHEMELATAVVIQYLSPVFAGLIAWLVLRERTRRIQWLFLGVCVLGVAMVKGFGAVETQWFLIGLSSAFFSGCAYNVIRALSGKESPHVILFYFPVVTLPLTGLWLFFFPEQWVQPVHTDWLLLLLFGLFTQAGQYFMTRAYQAEQVSKVTPATYTGVVYSLCFGWFLFGETTGIFELCGMMLVVAGVVLNTQTERLIHWWKKENPPVKAG
jgi:drug/metabolite transporter (DMT)-like permease